MGADEDDEEFPLDSDTDKEAEGENMAITGDVSRILLLCPKINHALFD